MTKQMLSVLSDHPSLGVASGLASGVTAWLWVMKYIIPVIGAVGTVAGAAAAVITLILKLRELRKNKEE